MSHLRGACLTCGTEAVSFAYAERFGDLPLPLGLNLMRPKQRADNDQEVFRKLNSLVFEAAHAQMITHHVSVTDDNPDFEPALDKAAAAALRAAFDYAAELGP